MGLKDILEIKKSFNNVRKGFGNIKKTDINSICESERQKSGIIPNLQGPPGTKQYRFYTAAGDPAKGSGKVLQEKLKSIVPLNPNFTQPTDRLLEAGINIVSEYILEGNAVRFIEEPENEYDPKAVRIEIDGIGYVGYVPRKKQNTVKSYRFGARNDKLVGLRYLITGGEIKNLNKDLNDEFDEVDDEVDERNEYFRIRVIFDHFE